MYYYDYREYFESILTYMQQIYDCSTVLFTGLVVCLSVVFGMLMFELIRYIRGLKEIYDKRRR